MDWFCSWHGAPTDNKWLLVGKCAGVAPGIVSAIWWALMDHASQARERGKVDDFDVETYAAFSGFKEEKINKVLEVLNEKQLILNGWLVAWEKRQSKDPGAAQRKRNQRTRERDPSVTDRDMSQNVTLHNTTVQDITKEKVYRSPQAAPRVRSSKTFLNGHAKDFETWYAAFPKHQARGDAEKAYLAALKDGATPEDLLTAALAYAHSRKGEEEKFTKLPATWLRKKCWLDATGPPESGVDPVAAKLAEIERPWDETDQT